MDAGILVSIIKSSIPVGVTFNDCGVAQRGFRYTINTKSLTVSFETCAINGIWGGTLDVSSRSWGFCGPITYIDFVFTSFEECADYLWKKAFREIIGYTGFCPSSFKSLMDNWFMLSKEDKFSLFEEVDFYASKNF